MAKKRPRLLSFDWNPPPPKPKQDLRQTSPWSLEDTREIHLLALEELKKRPEFQHPDKLFADTVIPDPDYSNSEDEDNDVDLGEPYNSTGRMSPHPNKLALATTGSTNGHMTPDDGLVMPRKLVNPCLESKEKQNLHRELLFNQKMGKNVLAQKSELKKAMDKFQSEQKKKEQEMEKLNKRTSLEKKLEEQAQKLKMMEQQQQSISEKTQEESEFQRIHAKLRSAKVEPQ